VRRAAARLEAQVRPAQQRHELVVGADRRGHVVVGDESVRRSGMAGFRELKRERGGDKERETRRMGGGRGNLRD
jgi:hypothetical protein